MNKQILLLVLLLLPISIFPDEIIYTATDTWSDWEGADSLDFQIKLLGTALSSGYFKGSVNLVFYKDESNNSYLNRGYRVDYNVKGTNGAVIASGSLGEYNDYHILIKSGLTSTFIINVEISCQGGPPFNTRHGDTIFSDTIYVYADNTAPAITFHPPAGVSQGHWTNKDSVSISYTASDAGCGVSGPASGSNTYISEGTHTYTVTAKDNLGNSATDSFSFGIDRTAPVFKISLSPSGWTNSTVKVSPNVSDALSGLLPSVQYSINGGVFRLLPLFPPGSVPVTEPGTIVSFRAYDRAGNLGTASIQVNTIDTTNPIIQSFSVKGSSASQKTIFFEGTGIRDPQGVSAAAVSGIDTGRFKYRINSDIKEFPVLNPIFSEGKLNFSIDFLQTGVYNVTLVVYDNAGNKAEYTAPLSVKIDNTPPDFSLPASVLAVKSGSGYNVGLTISNLVGCSSSGAESGVDASTGWSYAVDSGSYIGITGEYTADSFLSTIAIPGPLSHGSHTLRIKAADEAGNYHIDEMELLVDNILPGIGFSDSWSETSPGKWLNTTEFAISSSDDSGIKSFTCQIERVSPDSQSFNLQTINGTSGTFSLAGKGEGEFKVTLNAVDNAGNTRTAIIYARIDKTAPVISLSSTNIKTKSFTIIGSDGMSGINPDTWQWKIGSGVIQSGNIVSGYADGDGQTLTVQVGDIAGNAVEKSFTLKIDTEGPTVSFTADPFAVNQGTGKTLAVRNIVKTDNVSGVKELQYSINSGEFTVLILSGDKANIDLGNLAEGDYTLTIKAVDLFGNERVAAPHHFAVDETPPLITGFEIFSNEKSIPKGGYSASGSVSLKPDFSDNYQSDSGSKPGFVKYIYWDRKGSSEDLTFNADNKIDISDSNLFAEDRFTVSGLESGVNYIGLWAEDAAGNRSVLCDSFILYDGSNPAAPKINSVTHKRAKSITDAVPFRDAIFTLQENGLSPAGIDLYKWDLYKLPIDPGTGIFTGTNMSDYLIDSGEVSYGNDVSVSFTELEDNAENEFYLFKAAAVGCNGNSSTFSEYKFRIDTNAPAHLTLNIIPKVEADEQSNSSWFTASWQKPLDMTGVKEYRLYIGSPWENDDVPSSGWFTASNLSYEFNLKDFVSSDVLSGKERVALIAEDYAGQEALDYVDISFDYAKPEAAKIPGKDQAFYLSRVSENSISVQWGILSDAGSGIESRLVKLLSVNSFIRMFLSVDTFSHRATARTSP